MRLLTGPRLINQTYSLNLIRNLSNYYSFEYKPHLLTQKEKFKHVGELFRYIKEICSKSSHKSMLINELSLDDYPKENRSIMLYGLRRTRNYQTIIDIYEEIINQGSLDLLNKQVDNDSIILFAIAFSKTGDFVKVRNIVARLILIDNFDCPSFDQLMKLLDHFPSSHNLLAPNLFIQACCSQNK